MTDDTQVIEAPETLAPPRRDRREFFRNFGMAGAVGAGAALLGQSGIARAQAAPTDADVLNFALNLEYLEAQFYAFAVTGSPLAANLQNGTGTQGAATGGRAVAFKDPVVAALAREIAVDEIAHVRFLRTQLGTSAIAQPALDLSVSPTSAFSNAARAAGLIGANDSFDPYASDENFLLAGFLFEDVGVTAYKGASPLLTSKVFLEAAAGILAVEAYHAAMLRTSLYTKGIATPSLGLIEATESISTARDTLDGGSDIDQGIRPAGTGADTTSNIVPLDRDGIAFSRNTGQVLNIAFLSRARTDRGGFFPNGVNGTIRESAAN